MYHKLKGFAVNICLRFFTWFIVITRQVYNDIDMTEVPVVQSEEARDAKRSLTKFAEYCFGSLISNEMMPFHRQWYETLQDDNIKRGLIIFPRGSSKSTCWGKIGVVYLLGRNPDLRIVLVSRTSTLAKNNMRFIRFAIESNDRVKEVFPSRRIGDRVFGLAQGNPWGEDALTVQNNRNDGTPSVYAVGLEGSITGIRADVIIVDDLVDMNNVMSESQREKVKEFWNSVVIPTLNPDGRILVVGTRWHARDFYSVLMEDPTYKEHLWSQSALIEQEDGSLKSYWPDRFPVETLLKYKEDMGSLAFNAQYMCNVDGYAGTVFNVDDIHLYDPASLLPIWRDLDFVVSFDPNITDSPTSDNTAIITAAIDRKRSNVYILDIYAKPHDFTDQVKLIQKYGNRSRVRVGSVSLDNDIKIGKIGVDSTAYQRSLQQTGYLMGLPVVEIKTGNRDKVTRILGLQPHFENGRIRLPDPEKCHADWMEKFVEEYASFPKGRRDDMLDALEILVSMVTDTFGASGVPWGPSDTGYVRRLLSAPSGRPLGVLGGSVR